MLKRLGRFLWPQEAVHRNSIEVVQVPDTVNMSDSFTKPLDVDSMGRHFKEMIVESCEVKRGVASKRLSTLANLAVEETKKKGKFNMNGENSLHRGLDGAAEEEAALGD